MPARERTAMPLTRNMVAAAKATDQDDVIFLNKLVARTQVTASTCWEWMGARTTAQYGEISRNYEIHLTHRISWKLFNGPIPDGMHILHHCDNPPCWNPEHLFLGDNQANTDDKIAKGRMRHGHSYSQNI